MLKGVICIILVVFTVLIVGCSSIGGVTLQAPTPAPIAVVTTAIPSQTSTPISTFTPLEAPTIEKISVYTSPVMGYQAPDLIVGTWTVTNASVSPRVVFEPDGTGYASALFQQEDYSWNDTGSDGNGNLIYEITFNENNNIQTANITYNLSSDSATSTMTAADQFMIRTG